MHYIDSLSDFSFSLPLFISSVDENEGFVQIFLFISLLYIICINIFAAQTDADNKRLECIAKKPYKTFILIQ